MIVTVKTIRFGRLVHGRAKTIQRSPDGNEAVRLTVESLVHNADFYVEYQVESEGEDVHVFTVSIDAPDPETALQVAGHAGRRATFESSIALGPKDINFSARIVGREVAPRAA